MCKFIAHAKAKNMQIEIVPDYESMHVSFGQSFHPEYKEIRAQILLYLENQSERSDDIEYVGRWKGFYVYAHAADSGANQNLQFPVYYIVKEGIVTKVQDYRCIEISKRVRR